MCIDLVLNILFWNCFSKWIDLILNLMDFENFENVCYIFNSVLYVRLNIYVCLNFKY